MTTTPDTETPATAETPWVIRAAKALVIADAVDDFRRRFPTPDAFACAASRIAQYFPDDDVFSTWAAADDVDRDAVEYVVNDTVRQVHDYEQQTDDGDLVAAFIGTTKRSSQN